MSLEAVDFLEALQSPSSEKPAFRLGTIPAGYAGGLPTIQFDGEAAPGARRYPHLTSYNPVAGDRVLVAIHGKGGVIIGKVKNT